MDFKEKLSQFSKRIEAIKNHIQTEEATKTALIMPFFQMLGYDVFNPSEFVPEFTADVGIKKGEKIDYAIFLNNELSILLETKAINEDLTKHGSQLFRYYATLPARFGILTNGIIYKFYTDLDAPNVMDDRPFLEFNLLDIRDNLIPELKKFVRDNFDCDNILNSAAELKYTNEMKKLLHEELADPSDDFIRFMLQGIYPGVKTQNVIDKFRDTTKKAMTQFVNDILNDRFKAIMGTSSNADVSDAAATLEAELPEPEPSPKIITTIEELETFAMVKVLLKDVVSPSRISYKDTESYFGILLDDNRYKWICRIAIGKVQTNLFIQGEDKQITRYPLESLDDIYSYQPQLIEAVQRHMDK